jgi:hypothetical protein
MPPLPMTTGHYGRPRAKLPTIRLVNAYVESTEGGPTKEARLPRPGFALDFTLGAGPILRMFQVPGLFNSALFSVSGGGFYKDSALVETVPYGTAPRMAAAQEYLALVTGGALYVYDGTSLTLVEFFDDGVSRLPAFSGVSVLYNIWIFPVAGSNQFFFSAVGNPASINAANFGAAQTSPGPIVETIILAEEILFLCTDAVEFWDYSGSLTAPFAESQGRTYIRGCAAQGAVVKMDNAVFFVADDFSVYRTSAVPIKVSTPYIDDRLAEAGAGVSQCTAFTLSIEGHVFYVLNIPTLNESYAYDAQTKEWAQWGTQQPFQANPGLFAASCAAGFGSSIWLGDAVTGDVYLLDPSNNTDNGIAKRVIVSGALWRPGGIERCNTVALACVRGVGDPAAPDPMVEMRYSDDGGRTFTPWIQASLGVAGGYYYKAVWRGLGTMQQPGRLFEFSVSDPVNFTVEGASYNEARP